MKIEYKEYEIEMLDLEEYSAKNKVDIRKYKFKYSRDLENQEKTCSSSKHGIRVKNEISGNEISSAIICGHGGKTTIHPKCYLIENDKIWICVGDKIYCLRLPNLEIEWFKKFDCATNFSINSFKGDFIIHGELEIMRINHEGKVIWRFGGKDIFVTRKGEESFQIEGSIIKAKDWSGNKYIIEENGIDLT